MYYRKQTKRHQVTLDEVALKPVLADLEMGFSEVEYEALISALNELPSGAVSLIELRFFEGRSFQEIGEITGVSEGNAKIRLYRSVKMLRKVVSAKITDSHA